ncbi:HGxxPAAW family protein [Microbispora sp. NPDC049125]|uniref:HGxxPAAW family protein n=1 Tax=Microbispora sp. NPDC049125 TaxID=3154929 RepID=UPI003465CCF3
MHDDVDLGHTVAGWTGCVIALIGSAVAGVAVCAGRPAGVLAGAGIVLSAGLITWALHLMGWGKPSGPRPADEWAWRARDPMTGHGDCLACRVAGRRRVILSGSGLDGARRDQTWKVAATPRTVHAECAGRQEITFDRPAPGDAPDRLAAGSGTYVT